MAVEEKYKVQIIQCIEQSGFPSDLLNTFYMSDDFCFDVIYGWGYKLGSCIPENYFADMYDLPYVDFTQEYWSPSAMDTLTVNDSLYTFINDISMNKLDWAFFLYYNKQVAKDYNVETQFGSPYDLVTEGKWTLDRFLQMVTSVSNDLDGDGKIKPDDVYGIMDLTAVNIARASGISAVEKTTTAPTAFHT